MVPIKTKFSQKGFTMIELLVVVSIIGILAFIALANLNNFKERSYDLDTRTNLHNLYLACKVLWIDKGPGEECDVDSVDSTTYGFRQSPKVRAAVSGNEWTFSGTGAHLYNTSKKFFIDEFGTISEVPQSLSLGNSSSTDNLSLPGKSLSPGNSLMPGNSSTPGNSSPPGRPSSPGAPPSQ